MESNTNTIAVRKDLIIGILIGLVLLLVGYIVLDRLFYRAPALDSNSEATGLPAQEEETTNTSTETAKEWSIESDGPNIKNFYWPGKGLTFMYSPFVYLETEEYFGPDLAHFVVDPTVDIAGRLIFSRGSLEVFDKEISDTPERAVRVRFLGGENTATCVVKRVYPSDEDFVYLPEPNTIFVRMKGEGCPPLYRSDESLSATFFMLETIPGKLFFVTTSDQENVSLRTPTGSPFFASFKILEEEAGAAE
jgi:hypothetical protein